MNQPLIETIIEVDDDAFWNWLSDTVGVDLHDMTLTGVEARTVVANDDSMRETGPVKTTIRFSLTRAGGPVAVPRPGAPYGSRADA